MSDSPPAIPLDVFFLDPRMRIHGAEITDDYNLDMSSSETHTRTSRIVEVRDVDREAGAFVVRTETGSVYACRCLSSRLLDTILDKLEAKLAAA